MGWFQRMLGKRYDGPNYVHEPFGNGALVRDEKGSWVAWLNGKGGLVQEFKGKEILPIDAQIVAIRNADAALWSVWHAKGEALFIAEFSYVKPLVPGRFWIGQTPEDFRSLLFTVDGESCLPEPVRSITFTGSLNTFILRDDDQRCALVQVPVGQLPSFEFVDLREISPGLFSAQIDATGKRFLALNASAAPISPVEWNAISPPTWQLKEAWKNHPATRGDVQAVFRTPDMKAGSAVAYADPGQFYVFEAGREGEMEVWTDLS